MKDFLEFVGISLLVILGMAVAVVAPILMLAYYLAVLVLPFAAVALLIRFIWGLW